MKKFSLYQRCGFVIFDLLLILLLYSLLYCFGIQNILIYFSYPEYFTFYYQTILVILLCILVFIPVILLSISPIIKGIQSNFIFQKKIGKAIFLGIIISCLFSFSFDFYYLSTLDNKGYIKCKGGTLKGITNYAINKQQCFLLME